MYRRCLALHPQGMRVQPEARRHLAHDKPRRRHPITEKMNLTVGAWTEVDYRVLRILDYARVVALRLSGVNPGADCLNYRRLPMNESSYSSFIDSETLQCAIVGPNGSFRYQTGDATVGSRPILWLGFDEVVIPGTIPSFLTLLGQTSQGNYTQFSRRID